MRVLQQITLLMDRSKSQNQIFALLIEHCSLICVALYQVDQHGEFGLPSLCSHLSWQKSVQLLCQWPALCLQRELVSDEESWISVKRIVVLKSTHLLGSLALI
jgi:hypothetical protein